jgi:hypothetical protein
LAGSLTKIQNIGRKKKFGEDLWITERLFCNIHNKS